MPKRPIAARLTSLFQASDEQLMWRVKMHGDPEAFGKLLGRWQKPIESLCARMTGNTQCGEDLSQTAFTRVFLRRANWEPAAKFSTFVWRIALNLCHDQARRVRRRGECSLDALDGMDESLASDAPAPDAEAETSERAELVRLALLQLTPAYREVVVLRHYEGLKFIEIGEVLGIPEGTVKSRMAEALSRLNNLLKHLNEDSSCKPTIRTPEVLAL